MAQGAADRDGNRGFESYLRTSEVARLLYVSPKTVTRWASEGRLPSVRTLGGHRRFREQDILDLRKRLGESPEL